MKWQWILLSMQYKYETILVHFLYYPILPQRSHFMLGLWWATGPTLPRYWPNFTPNNGVMMSHWIFSVLFELIIVNWNPFQRGFSKVAPVSWHINFISGSYDWGVRARFVIFGCSLPHLTILLVFLCTLLSLVHCVKHCLYIASLLFLDLSVLLSGFAI